jgi:hypothetical protein
MGVPFVAAVVAYGGCSSGKATTTGTGGATSTTTHGSVTITAGGGGPGGAGTCVGDGPDGICQYNLGEDCNCKDCLQTALCIPDACLQAGMCDHALDACTCPVCWEDAECGDPGLHNCNDDGVCDPFVEGCHCKDCWNDPNCGAGATSCNGGKPDGTCDYQHGETCDCVDCQGTPLCVMCAPDGMCGVTEPCYCADCLADPGCNDPAMCTDDGTCATLVEGCACQDCQSWPQCQPDGGAPDGGGTGGAGAGGGAGTGGSAPDAG